MHFLIVPAVVIAFSLPVSAEDCASIVASVCIASTVDQQQVHKILTVKPTVQDYAVGERFPIESRSLLMDPSRYNLKSSDGNWRYYAMSGLVYRVAKATGEVLEVIRGRRVAHLR